jgi:DNA-binding NtrC family response regulator
MTSSDAKLRGSVVVVGDAESDLLAVAAALRSLADTRLLTVTDAVALGPALACDVLLVDQDRSGRTATQLLAETPAALRLLLSSDQEGRPVPEHGEITTLPKPVDLRALRALCVTGLRYAGAARTARTLEEENRWLRGAPGPSAIQHPPDLDHYEGLLTRSPLMRRVLGLLRKIEGTISAVLIHGEPGTGKELVARAIHARSRRRGAPFLALNLGGLGDDVREYRLFGAAITTAAGRHARQEGLLAAADGGCLFLDEVGRANPALQVGLLRVLEEGVVRPVGSDRDRRVDVRLIAGTSRDLVQLVKEGIFRRDLYDRLEVVRIDLPPLRQRAEDVVVLAQHFLAQAAQAIGRTAPAISREARAALEAHGWPGNLHELRNAMERAAILAGAGPVVPAHLGIDGGRPGNGTATAPADGTIVIPEGGTTLRRLEQEIFLKTLVLAGGNQSRAAAILGLCESTFRFRLRKLGIASRRARPVRSQATPYPQQTARA